MSLTRQLQALRDDQAAAIANGASKATRCEPGTVPTPERVASLLEYDPHSGTLYWLEQKALHIEAGQEAGTESAQAWIVTLDGYRATRARVAWCLYHGEWPATYVRHANGDKHDDRIINLRLAGTVSRVPAPRGHENVADISHCETHPASLFLEKRDRFNSEAEAVVSDGAL